MAIKNVIKDISRPFPIPAVESHCSFPIKYISPVTSPPTTAVEKGNVLLGEIADGEVFH